MSRRLGIARRGIEFRFFSNTPTRFAPIGDIYQSLHPRPVLPTA